LVTEIFGVKVFMLIQLEEIKKVIENYIRNQLQEDIVAEQLTLVEYIDPFTGEETKKKK